MKLKQLLTAIEYRAEQVPDVNITDLVYDSRKAVPGCCVVACAVRMQMAISTRKRQRKKVPPSSSQRSPWKRPCRSF